MSDAIRGHADHWIPGDWNAECYVCGRKYKASEMRKHWQGYMVCDKDWEPRQPQDFVRGVPDQQTPPWVQARTEQLVFLCAPNGRSGIVDYGVVGCMVVGATNPIIET